MKNLSANLVLFCLLLVLFSSGVEINENAAQSPLDPVAVSPPFLPAGPWADSVFNALSPEERIAQLFVVAAYSNKGPEHIAQTERLIREQHIGGLIFFQGGPLRQAQLTNRYQSLSKVPLLISMDAEWGLSMRLDSTIRYPRQMMLGAVNGDSLIYRMGADIAAQCRRLGVQVNLAPVVDVNNNSANPVINSRSFGELKENVAEKGIAYMRGMQDHHVLACAKHFPGHGDTDSDSHLTLPVIRHSRERLDSLEMYPFRKMISAGVGAIMVAHLFVPALDPAKNRAATLSEKIVTGTLKNQMGFNGLVFTDALNMQGVSRFYKPGDLDVKALLAGNDILLFSEDVPLAIEKIKQAIDSGLISQAEIDKRCLKMLALKEWAGLDHRLPVQLKGLVSDLNQLTYRATKRRLIASALTLLKNTDDLIPLKRLDTLRIASVAIGARKENAFQKTLHLYASIDTYQISKSANADEISALMKKLENNNLVFISVHGSNEKPWKHFGLGASVNSLIERIERSKKAILTVFANPYALKYIPSCNASDALIIAYEDRVTVQDYAAQLLFGGIPASGQLPVTATPAYPAGSGIIIPYQQRFQYTLPEDAGINSADLDSISIIARQGIIRHAYPGCQVLVAKDKKIIYNRSFGFHTYDAKRKVKPTDLYDLASVTKIGATVPALMLLSDRGELDIDKTLGDYLPEMLDTTAYSGMVLREMLAHQAGLVSWIPFYLKTLDKGDLDDRIYSHSPSAEFPYRVAENIYISRDYPQEIYRRILDTKINERGNYVYSDLGYYFFLKIVEKLAGRSLDEFMNTRFYKPLGMTTTCYHPRDHFTLDQIVPTEYDMQFRKQLVHGDVHDPGAAMLGGVGGHAGLFSSANDLAKLMQMFLNKGAYGGEHFLSDSVLSDFTRCQFCETGNRRGAGFDKPTPDGSWGPTCNCISLESFGHSGFTGTLAWADPDKRVVYVFLSNRVYPDATNNKLVKLGTRTRIMQVIYDAIEKSENR